MRTILLIIIVLTLSTKSYAQTVITVGPSGGDFESPIDALEAVGTSLPAATAAGRYIIKLLPGTYKISEPVRLKRYVSLVGSGRLVTKIYGKIPDEVRDGFITYPYSAVIQLASDTEVSALSVENGIARSSSYVISGKLVKDVVIQNLEVLSTGKALTNTVWKTGIWFEHSDRIYLSDVMTNIEPTNPTACIGARAKDSTVRIQRSQFFSENCRLSVAFAASEGSKIFFEDSQLLPQTVSGDFNTAVYASGTQYFPRTRITATNSRLSGFINAGQETELFPSKVRVLYSAFDGEVFGSNNPYCYRVFDSAMNTLDRDCR